MSSSLLMTPIIAPPEEATLSTAMKFLLRKRFYEHQSGEKIDIELDRNHVQWLQGVSDAGSGDVREDAKLILAGIEKYGSVRVRED